MKKFLLFVTCLGLFSALIAAEDKKPAAPEVQPDVSYSLGMLFGANLKSSGLKIDSGTFLAGLQDALEGKTLRYTEAEATAAVQASFQAIQDKKKADNLAAGKAFLESNSQKAGVKVTSSGLQYEVLTLGTGPKPLATDTVKVDYEGKLLNGTVFDSSIERKEPVTFQLDGVIPGWTEGLQLMPVGSKFRFYIPSDLAYGEKGAGNAVEPNSTLIFEVQLLSIETEKK
jgi:FKBP-type peptidyl-prolyl cis-trans isomerase